MPYSSSKWTMPGLLFSVVLLAPVIGVAYEPGHGYMVHGGIGCATYTAQYDFNLQKRLGEGMVTMEFSQTHGWIKGYLTAYNAWARNDRIDVSAGFGTDDIERWLAGYCEEHQEGDLPDALKEFVKQSIRDPSLLNSSRGI